MCFQFLPISFFNMFGGNFTSVTLDELLHLFDLLYSMDGAKITTA